MLPFDLPPPFGSIAHPIWDGTSFLIGDKKSPVLEYSENFSGWSDDLTDLHEEFAGDSHPIDIASRENAISQVRRVLKSNSPVIVEIGCSSGFLLKKLLNNFPKATIIGADIVREPLYRLSKQLPGLPLIRFDLLKCSLPADIADVIIMLNVLEHIEDDIEALKQAYRLLKPGGYLIIEVPACQFLYDAYDAKLRHYRRYSMKELHSKLFKAGFVVERSSHLGFFLFPVFAMVKLVNKFFRSGEDGDIIVREQAAKTSNSILLRFVMALESSLSALKFPFGIRCLVSAVKK
jgi:SAM-dependent methyltransferase